MKSKKQKGNRPAIKVIIVVIKYIAQVVISTLITSIIEQSINMFC